MCRGTSKIRIGGATDTAIAASQRIRDEQPVRAGRFGRIAWMTVLLLVLLMARTEGQMVDPLLSVGLRPWAGQGTCADAPLACDGPVWDGNLGPHEFVVHRVPALGRSQTVALTLWWPPSWSVLGWDLCDATLISGDPAIQGSELQFAFPCEDQLEPFLRIRLDCTVPGRFNVASGPVELCSGQTGYEALPLYADVGQSCGAWPYNPCDACGPPRRSGYFQPGQLEVTVPAGAIWADTLAVSGDGGPTCPGLPECGGDGPGACFVGVFGEPPEWLSAQLLLPARDGYHEYPYKLRVDARELGAGVYTGKVYAHGSCCPRSCADVRVIVAEPAGVSGTSSTAALLGVPFPNPMREALSFRVTLPEPAHATAEIIDASGRLVAHVLDQDLPAGGSVRSWAPSNEFRRMLPAGVYFLRVSAGARAESRVFVMAD